MMSDFRLVLLMVHEKECFKLYLHNKSNIKFNLFVIYNFDQQRNIA